MIGLEVKTKTTGFGSPAETYVDKRLDLNDLIPIDIMTTYYFKYGGEEKYGLSSGSILVVDKSIDPKMGDLVLIKGDNIMVEKYSGQKDIWGTITWNLMKMI